MAISNERIRLSEFLAQDNPAAVADFISKTPKLQKAILDFYGPDLLDMNALIDGLKNPEDKEKVESIREFIDRYLEVKSGKLPIGKLPHSVRKAAARDERKKHALLAKESFSSAVSAYTEGRALSTAFNLGKYMYQASSSVLSAFNLTVREKRLAAVLGTSMLAVNTFGDTTTAAINPEEINDAINNANQTRIEESMVARPRSTEAAESVYKLSINKDMSLTFKDKKSYQKAKDYIENAAYETYMGAPVSREIRMAFVAGDALTPYPYEFWQGQAFAESTFDTKALNDTTLARGIMQMTPDTTLEILYDMKDNPQYGFIPEAQLVTRTFDDDRIASYSVRDGIDKQAVVASVAYDPLKAVMVAAEYNSKYFSLLQKKYPEQEMTSVHAYALHWQGYTGSQKLFAAKPDTSAVEVYGAKSGVVQNHKTIFYEDAKNAKGERTVEEMLAYLQSDRGLGNIAIPEIAEWAKKSVSLSFAPVSGIEVAEKYKDTLPPVISRIPKKRPDFSAKDQSAEKTMKTSLRPQPKPADFEPG